MTKIRFSSLSSLRFFALPLLCLLVLLSSTSETLARPDKPQPDKNGSKRRSPHHRHDRKFGGKRGDKPSGKHSHNRRRCRERGKERWKGLGSDHRESLKALTKAIEDKDFDKKAEFLRRLRSAKPEQIKALLANLKKVAALPQDQRTRELKRLHEDKNRKRLCKDLDRNQHRSRYDRFKKHLPKEVQAKLSAAKNSDERHSILKAHFSMKKKEYYKRRQEMIQQLPSSVRKHVESLSSEREQSKVIRRYFSNQLLMKVFDTEPERGGLLKLSPKDLHTLLRQRDGSKPNFISKESWDRWLKLKSYERGRLIFHLHHLQGSHPGGPRGHKGCGKSSKFRPTRSGRR